MTLSQAVEYMQDCTMLSLYCILNSDIFWHLIFMFISTCILIFLLHSALGDDRN